MSYEIISVEVNTPEWLGLRKQGIGGSDAAAAIGQSAWRTPYQLWLEKTNQDVSDFEMDWWAAQTGHALEPKIREWYSREHAQVQEIKGICRSIKYPFMQFTADGYVECDNAIRGFEAKKYLSKDGWGEPGTDEVPDDYMIQVQHGMIVAGWEAFDISVSFWGNKPVIYHIEAHKELQQMIIDDEAEFWEKVQKYIEPEITTTEDIKRRYRFSNGKSIVATDELVNACADLKNIKSQIKSLEEQETQVVNRLKFEIGDFEVLEYEGKSLATWKSIKPGQKFDLDTFKAVYPEIYSKYLIESASQRRFLVK